MHAGFFLLRRVKDDDFEKPREPVRSGSTTPTGEVCLDHSLLLRAAFKSFRVTMFGFQGDARSVTSEISGVDLPVDPRKSRSVLALIPSKKSKKYF